MTRFPLSFRVTPILLALSWLASPGLRAQGTPTVAQPADAKRVVKPAPFNPPERIRVKRTAAESATPRAFRYHAEGTDFVIENGKEFFNRSLYGANTAFRVDAGDLPEFMLYMPRRGGNLRLGLVAGEGASGAGNDGKRQEKTGGAKWLYAADSVTARYRPGSMVYEIRDKALLGESVLQVTAMATRQAEGLIARVELLGGGSNAAAPELFWAFGCNDGKKGSRGGDIGCERQPVSQFFQLNPAGCESNAFSIGDDGFKLKGATGTLHGVVTLPTRVSIADADQWNAVATLLESSGMQDAERPVALGRAWLKAGQPYYIYVGKDSPAVDKAQTAAPSDALPGMFEATEKERAALAGRVTVRTPDAAINAAAAALCVAADGVWDSKLGAVMHGAVAWRTPLLGWRGTYVNDALGWHDRAEHNFDVWSQKQSVEPVPAAVPKPDDASNLARDEAALKSNGAMSFSHYDMNLVFIDALLRHLLWTGDMAFAKEQWPTLERHLAWERRLFRRPFGKDGELPLYEAYAAIWASDDLEYEGGGVTHASAYNYYQNKMAARLAVLIGKDPKPYRDEANLILKAMRQELWLPSLGRFAEWKDLLGERLTHPDAGAWTTYHAIDSEVPSALDAWQMARDLVTRLPRIPVGGGDDPARDPFTISTTDWTPYQWSTNNVVMAESAHSALALWQAGTPEEAFNLFKGCILDSMFMGLCPGNVGMTTGFDAARGESQRDFGDGTGAMARALVEGLFGVRPDLLAGTLRVAPGLPDAWNQASIDHPDFSIAFKREGAAGREIRETWTIEPKFRRPVALDLAAPARHGDVMTVLVNDKEAAWDYDPDAVGFPRVRVKAPVARRYQVVIVSMGNAIVKPAAPGAWLALGDVIKIDLGTSLLKQVADPQGALENLKTTDHGFEARVAGGSGPRAVFARVEQRDKMESLPFPIGYKVAKRPTWWAPVVFEARPALEVLDRHAPTADRVSFGVSGTGLASTKAQAASVTVSDGVRVATGTASMDPSASAPDSVRVAGLLPGTLRVRIMAAANQGESANGKILVEGNVTNWMLSVPKDVRLSPVNLAPYYNDSVTRIFENAYVEPRSTYPSLAIPKQGVGSWCDMNRSFEVNDEGLRFAAAGNGGQYALPNGVFFNLPFLGQAKNAVFASQWKNYPKATTIPLSGTASRVYLLMAGSTNSMQSRFDNGEVIVTYADGSTDRLALRNPETWWPIDQDYFIDGHAFHYDGAIPPRVDLATGKTRMESVLSLSTKGGSIDGGAAMVLDLPLDPAKPLKSLGVHAIANEVVIGLMAATLAR